MIESEWTSKKYSANAFCTSVLQLFQIMYPDELRKKCNYVSVGNCVVNGKVKMKKHNTEFR